MCSTDDELAILDKTGGPAMVLPLLLIVEFCFVGLFISGLRGHISDVPLFSVAWWIIELISGGVALANGMFLIATLSATFRTFGKPAFLRINANGIWLPYESRSILWSDIEKYYIKEDRWIKGGAMNFLYVALKDRRFWQSRNVMVIGRKVFDNEDISNCMAWIDRYLPLS